MAGLSTGTLKAKNELSMSAASRSSCGLCTGKGAAGELRLRHRRELSFGHATK